MVTVYILHSNQTDRYYVGFTQNISKRLKKHRTGQNRSTAFATDWNVMWSQKVESTVQARQLEVQIKSRGASRFLQSQTS